MCTDSQYCKYELKGSFPCSHKPATFQASKSDSKGGEESLILQTKKVAHDIILLIYL